MKLLFILTIFISTTSFAQRQPVKNSKDTIVFPVERLEKLFSKKLGDTLSVDGNDKIVWVEKKSFGTVIQAKLKKRKDALLTVTKFNDGHFSAKIIRLKGDYFEWQPDGYFLRKQNPVVEFNNEQLIINLTKKGEALLALKNYVYSLPLTQREKDSIFLKNGGYCYYWDLNGHNLTGNGTWGNILSPASTINGVTASIDSVMTLAKEYFTVLPVILTTDSTLYFIADAYHRKRVVQTTDNSWYGSVLGVSAINSMAFGDETPSYSFDVVGAEKAVAKARILIHEFAHTVGAYHQTFGGATATGSETDFAPVMTGISQTRNMQIWWKGTSPETGQVQDDALLISQFELSHPAIYTRKRIFTSQNDHGNSINHARIIFKDKPIFGFIGYNDSDYVKFSLAASQTVTITAVPFSLNATGNVYATLDVAIDLYGEGGNLITSSTNTTVLNASISQSLSAGTYYIKVRPDRGNANNPTGYGFIGHYTINYTF